MTLHYFQSFNFKLSQFAIQSLFSKQLNPLEPAVVKALVRAMATGVQVIVTMAIIIGEVLCFLNNFHSFEAAVEEGHSMGLVQFC